MAYKKFKNSGAINGGKDLYVEAAAKTGAKIIVPDAGVITLDADGVTRLLNYLISLEYKLYFLNKNESYYKKSNALGYFVENESNIIQINVQADDSMSPKITLKVIDTATSKVTANIVLNEKEFQFILTQIKNAGFEATIEDMAIQFVDALPSETAAKRGVVYLNDGKYYTLNKDEDALDELKGTFQNVPNFPAWDTLAKENVLYNLTAKMDNGGPFVYQMGVYTYNKTKNEFALEDLTIKKTDNLPAVEKAKQATVYVLTKQFEGKEKGTAWKLNKNADAYEQETRAIENASKLPIVPLAVDGVYYIVNGTVKKAVASSKTFTDVGRIKKVDALPDVSKITVDSNFVYILSKADGNKPAGSMWIFDTELAEFVEYPYTDDGSETITGPAGGGGAAVPEG